MKNLAGNSDADLFIQDELLIAGIELVKIRKVASEVPYSIIGKLNNWEFERAWYYWRASATDGEGIPLDVAIELNDRKIPRVVGNREKYGEVIRVIGSAGGADPRKWATHYDAEGIILELDPTGKRKAELDHMVEKFALDPEEHKYNFVLNLEDYVAKSVINSYHIDSQLGLNEFAKVIREL